MGLEGCIGVHTKRKGVGLPHRGNSRKNVTNVVDAETATNFHFLSTYVAGTVLTSHCCISVSHNSRFCQVCWVL